MLSVARRSLLKASTAVGVTGSFIDIGQAAETPIPWQNGTYTLAMFGAKGAGQDDARAVAGLNEAVVKHLTRLTDEYKSSFGYIESGLVVDLTGIHSFSNTLILYPGVDYRLPTGSTLSAYMLGQTVVRTASRAELALFRSVYGCSATRMHGGGYIDGRGLASVGFMADTVTDCSKFDFTVVRCTHRRYRTMCSIAKAGKKVTVSDAKNIVPGDVVYIENTKQEFFSVISVNGCEILLSDVINDVFSKVVFEHRACGIVGLDAQISYFSIQAHLNDIGCVFAKNSDNIQCTDLRVTGKFEFNMIGILVVAGDGRFRDITSMHNFDREIVIVNGIASVFDGVYLESMSDSQAATLKPPIPEPATLHEQPLVDIRGGRSTWRDINWPTNPKSTRFRRLMRNQGDTLVENVVGASVPLLAHPADPNDYAMFEDVQGGHLVYRDVRGWSNLSESIALHRTV